MGAWYGAAGQTPARALDHKIAGWRRQKRGLSTKVIMVAARSPQSKPPAA